MELSNLQAFETPRTSAALDEFSRKAMQLNPSDPSALIGLRPCRDCFRKCRRRHIEMAGVVELASEQSRKGDEINTRRWKSRAATQIRAMDYYKKRSQISA